jgi:hypothetical protein
MTGTAAIDRPPVAEPVSRRRSAKPATISASALAQHLDCSRTYIGKLEADGVIQRQGDGFPLDRSRVDYLRYLRREHWRSPRTGADADHVKVQDRDAATEADGKEARTGAQGGCRCTDHDIAGVTLTALSSLPARCAPRGDLAIWRSIERVVFEVRTEIANVCQQMADKCGEPSLDEQ